jgi:hypothetical protein
VTVLAVALACPAGAAAGAARPPTHLWYRITVFGSYDERIEGSSPAGIVRETESVSWQLHSNTATTVSRTRAGLSTGANLRGSITAYDLTSTNDLTVANTGATCTQRASYHQWLAPDEARAQLSGNVTGLVTRPAVGLTGGSDITVEGSIVFTCPGGSSRTPATQVLGVGALANVLLPPAELLRQHGLTPDGRMRFGKFFSLSQRYTVSRPLDQLYVGATGTWTRTWDLDIWFKPCPNLRC